MPITSDDVALVPPTCCPVCGLPGLERILPALEVLVRHEDTHAIGGLFSYRCLTWGHIFFIRVSDLESARSAAPNR